MHKLESVLENKKLKILWDYQIKTDYLIPTRRPYLVLINTPHKKNLLIQRITKIKSKKAKTETSTFTLPEG